MTRVKVVAAVLVVTAALLGTGAGVFSYRLRAEQGPAPRAQAGPRPREAPAAPPARGRVEEDKDREAARMKRLLEQMKMAEERRRQLEDKWHTEVVRLRLSRIEEEERMRSLERTQAAEREREQAEIVLARKQLGQAGKDADKSRERLELLEAMARKGEKQRIEEMIRARQNMAKVEEILRPLERRLGHQIEQAEAVEDAAAARLREAEGLAAPPPTGAPRLRELERKVDALLREMTELRRAVERPRPLGGTRPREQ